MKSQEITVLFPTPDYAVVAIDGVPLKSFSAEPGDDKTATRAILARDVRNFCDGLGYGFGHAIQTLQKTSLDMRTKL